MSAARGVERPSEDAVQRLFELTADMLGTSAGGYFTELNPAWERSLGWTREELMAEPFISFVHPDDVAATRDRAAAFADPETQAVVAFENRYRTRSGDYRFLHWTTVAADGFLYFAAKDVTDRRASETEREQAATLSRAITDNVADGLLVAGSDGAIVYANPAGRRMLGYDDGELIGRDCQAGLQTDGGFWRKDGSVLQAASTSSAVPVAEGTGRIIVFRDVSAQRAEAAARHQAEQLIRHSEALRRTLTANLPDTSVFLLDRDLRILIADGEAIQRLGYLGADMFRGRKVTELYAEVPDEVLELCLEHYRAGLEGERRTFDLVSDGLTFAMQAVPVHAADDTVESLLVVARDVTEPTHAQQQLARRARQQNAVAALGRFALGSHDLTELMTEAVTVATFTLDVDLGRVLELDPASERLRMVASVGMADTLAGMEGIPLNVNESEAAAHTLRTGGPSIVEDMPTETRFTPSPTLLGLGVVSSLSVAIEGHDQPFGVLNVNAREPREFSADEVEFLSAIATLIIMAVERDRGEQVTRHAALHDPLTGLPNRTLALDRLEQALGRRQRDRIDVAVFVLDIDGFKLINDSLGHAAGDDVLLALTPRLTAALRASDTVARLGGDEFVVICPDVDGVLGSTDVAERLAAAIARPLSLDSGEHFFTVSVGGTLAASKHDTPESLLGDADAAMYRAKARGRGGYELFDEAMRTSLIARVRTETELRHALNHDELVVYYQPVIDLASGRPVSTEALVRWQHPERGLIPPLEFIPIAEETGLIAMLGLQVLEIACRQTAVWQRDVDPAIGVSVNVSGRQVVNPLFPAQAAAVVEHSGLRAGTLALEITETVLMEEADSPATVLDSFQAHGLSLMLDDFGTGYASLSRLKRFPLDVLKIDRSFISGIETNADDRAIVKATIDMAHAVGLTVVAEGVETSEQEERLRGFGCDRAQGYLYARPQPAEAIAELLAAARR